MLAITLDSGPKDGLGLLSGELAEKAAREAPAWNRPIDSIHSSFR